MSCLHPGSWTSHPLSLSADGPPPCLPFWPSLWLSPIPQREREGGMSLLFSFLVFNCDFSFLLAEHELTGWLGALVGNPQWAVSWLHDLGRTPSCACVSVISDDYSEAWMNLTKSDVHKSAGHVISTRRVVSITLSHLSLSPPYNQNLCSTHTFLKKPS